MEAVVRAVAKKKRLLVIGALVEVMPQFVMNRCEVVGIDFNTHLHTQIVGRINVPCRSVAHYVAITRMYKLGTLPEGFGKWGKSKRGKKVLAIINHVLACREAGGMTSI